MSLSKKIFTRLFAASAVAAVMLTSSACSANEEKEKPTPTKEIASVYEGFINDTFNHKVETAELIEVDEKVFVILGEAGEEDPTVAYEPAIKYLDSIEWLKTSNLYMGDNIDVELGTKLRVLNLMSFNTIHDTITVKVDQKLIKQLENGNAEIPRKALVFSSEKNDETGLGDRLTKGMGSGSERDSGIMLIKTDKGFKVDLTTTDF